MKLTYIFGMFYRLRLCVNDRSLW